jgi:hypothetical protein
LLTPHIKHRGFIDWGKAQVAWLGAALMWNSPQGMVYLATGHHDMRKSLNGLALVVAKTMGLDPVGPTWDGGQRRSRPSGFNDRPCPTDSASLFVP